MPSDQDTELREQRRVARKYRLLGYDVLENPDPEALPEFLRGLSPGIVARSAADNVIIEVKRNAALKGSNDLIQTAEAVSGHEDWRFELVVLGKDPDPAAVEPDVAIEGMMKKARLVASMKLYDLACVYLADVLVGLARDLARENSIKLKTVTDRDIFLELGFQGVLPDRVVQKCLDALAARNIFVHATTAKREATESEVNGLLELCGQVRDLS